jgi:hypothetical protein
VNLVSVGVIDSGWNVNENETRVRGGVSLGVSSSTSETGLATDTNDEHGHGTIVTRVLLRSSPIVSATPIRIFGRQLEASPSALIAAIEWGVDFGLPLLNLSLGTTRADAAHGLYDACDRAVSRGTIIVAAAQSYCDSLPASFDTVISVQCEASLLPGRLRFTPGSIVECLSRGVYDIFDSHVNRVVTKAASSYAAPEVTAKIAEYLHQGGSRKLKDVRSFLAGIST